MRAASQVEYVVVMAIGANLHEVDRHECDVHKEWPSAWKRKSWGLSILFIHDPAPGPEAPPRGPGGGQDIGHATGTEAQEGLLRTTGAGLAKDALSWALAIWSG